MTTPYLVAHPPRTTQFRPRRAKVTGCIVVHTAESQPDEVGPDDGTINVARFIRDRTTYGSYHWLADSDSILPVVPVYMAAYGDGTGSNEFAIHVSAATQAHRWTSLSKAWRRGCVKNMALCAANSAKWLKKEHGITVPAKRITKAQSDKGMPGFISHGERDPGRRSDPGKDFPWGMFLAEFEAAMGAKPTPEPKPEPDEFVLKMSHASMQFSDSDAQMEHDIDKLFSRPRHVITGTEAGGAKAQPMPDLLKSAAKEYGYRLHIEHGDWIAIDRDFINGGWDEGFIPVLKPNASHTGNHTARGVPWAAFDNDELGRMAFGAGHYLTKGRIPKDPNYELNTLMTQAVGEFGREHGKGKGLAFYSGDQNIVDRTSDTFRGQPFTSAWDELEKWQNTGHGNIDVIASWDADARVKARGIRARDDRKFFLHTDHYLVDATFFIRKLKG